MLTDITLVANKGTSMVSITRNDSIDEKISQWLRDYAHYNANTLFWKHDRYQTETPIEFQLLIYDIDILNRIDQDIIYSGRHFEGIVLL